MPELHRVQLCVIAVDDAGFFQQPDAAQAGRRGQSHQFSEFNVGDSCIVLQLDKDRTIYSIHFLGSLLNRASANRLIIEYYFNITFISLHIFWNTLLFKLKKQVILSRNN